MIQERNRSMDTKQEQRMRSGPLIPLILSLSLPSVVAQLINVLYNIVDRMYIGHIPGEGAQALTGLGVSFPIIMIISAFSAFAGAGGAPLAAIELGRGNREGAEKILGSAITMLLAFSVIRKQHSFAAKYGIAAEYANSIIPSGIIDGFSVQAEHPAVVRQFIDELDPVLVRGPGAVGVPVALLERNYVRCFGSYIFSNLLHCGKLSEPEIVAHYFKGVVFLPCECGNCGRNGNKCGKKYLFHIYIHFSIDMR